MMQVAIGAILSLSLLATAQSVAPSSHSRWRPGSYAGLQTGSATLFEFIHKFGKSTPVYQPPNGEKKLNVSYTRQVLEPFKGDAEFTIERGILIAVDLTPAQRVTRKDIEKRFGSPDAVRHYQTDDCGDTGEDFAPICPSRKGDIEFLFYPRLGMYVWIQESVDEVKDIAYATHAPKYGKCRCKE